jgi:hypothetical protein
LNLVKDEGALFRIERCVAAFFGAASEPGPFQRLEDRGQAPDPFLGACIQGSEIGDFALESIRFPGHGQHHGFERINVVGKLRPYHRHAAYKSIFRPQ